MLGLLGGEEIYKLIKSHENGISLDDIAKQYQVSPTNPDVLILIAQLLADGKVKQEMRGKKLYCVAVEVGTEEPGAEKKP